jgi:hypothetical protein
VEEEEGEKSPMGPGVDNLQGRPGAPAEGENSGECSSVEAEEGLSEIDAFGRNSKTLRLLMQ